MDFGDIDIVKIEKAKAMKRYRRLQNVAKAIRGLEFCAALMLISWSSTRLPFALSFVGHYVRSLSVHLLKPIAVFLIGNGIVLAIYMFSRQKVSGERDCSRSDLSDDYIQQIETHLEIAFAGEGETSPVPAPAPETEEANTSDGMQIVPVVENEDAKSKCEEVEEAIKQAAKEISRFQRTQSEKLRRELRSKPRPVLRRSETDTRRRNSFAVVDDGAVSSFHTVEDLSSEEFRRTVEAFIDQQKMFQKMNSI